jgi:hypothetical protein
LRRSGDVGRMWRRDVRLPSDSKSPRPVSRRGLNSCDVGDMPVICPTCQIIRVIFANAFLVKSLNWRRGLCAGNRFGSSGGRRRRLDAGNCFGSFGSWRRTYLRGRLFPGAGAGLSCIPRPGSRCGTPDSPGMRDRGPRRISDERTCHRAHGSQHDGSRHRAQGSTSGTILSPCFKRNK